MRKHYWQLYANYQAFGRLFKTIIFWQLCKLRSYGSNVELLIILYWYIYVFLYWNILLWVFGDVLCLFSCLHFSRVFLLTPTLWVGISCRVTGPEGVSFHHHHHLHPLFFTSWRPSNRQAKIRCRFITTRLLWRPVHILPFQNPVPSSAQAKYSSTCPKFCSLCFFLRWEHIFHLHCAADCALSLSLYYSLYLINEEQASCLCLFITSLDVTFEDKETSLMIYNISYTLCTDSKL